MMLLGLVSCAHFGHAQSYWLPEDYRVYARDGGVVNHSYPGFKEVVLPTINEYQGEDGGYIAIYTREKEGSSYEIGKGIYVVGQVRIQGTYHRRVFVPTGYQPGDDITQDPELIALCEKHFPGHAGKLWIGGDTGGWFGIPS